MKDKFKRQTNAHPTLARVARFLYWVGWIGVALSVFRAIEAYSQYSVIAWGSSPQFHTFYHAIWVPLIGAILVFLLSGTPSCVMILISRLIAWGLRLKEENRALEELTRTLIRERDDAVVSQRLMEKDAISEDLSEHEYYEPLSIGR